MLRMIVVVVMLLLTIRLGLSQGREAWQLTYETSGGLESGTYDEAVAFCSRLDLSSSFAEYRSFGMSPEGRELPLLLVDTSPQANPPDEPLIFIIAGIHSGEIDGKDAGLMLIRDCLIHHDHSGLLDGVRIGFVPVFNVDGHERRSAYNRVNQRGPKEMGWRTTARNLNLNRDWLKADAVEMRAMLTLIDSLQPDFLMDIHVTDGADYQYVVTYGLNMYENELEPLRNYCSRNFLPTVQAKMQAQGLTFVPYGIFKKGHDVTSGWVCPVWEPRYSTGYGTVINRPFILIETHSLKDYRTRVQATYTYLKCAIETIKLTRTTLVTAVHQADKLAADLSGKQIHLNWQITDDSTMVKFLGFQSSVDTSDILGGPVTNWSDSAVTLSVPLFDKHRAEDTVLVPQAYVIPAPWMDPLSEVLAAHGVDVHRTAQPIELEVETYKFDSVTFSPTPFEGRFRTSFKRSTKLRTVRYPAGSGVVILDQPKSLAAVHLLEPDAPDSFVKWGFMPEIFEQKEYAADYAMDSIGAHMLQASPELKNEFEERIRADSAFASSMDARIQFLYERSLYWDERKDVYPIGRIHGSSQLAPIKKIVPQPPKVEQKKRG